MGERLRVTALLVALSVPLSAEAGFDEDLAAVRAQVQAGAHKDALKSLKNIEKALDELDTVVSTRSLARLWFYKGAAEFGVGNKKGRAEDAWRQALSIENEFPWDTELMGESDLISLFEALRGEVEGRGYVDTGVPEAIGAAKLYVDGARHEPEETVIAGIHLAQIECPDGQGTFSTLTDFSKPVDWFEMCPDGVDTSVVVAEEEEDEWAEFGPSFGTPTEEPVTTESSEEPSTSPGTEPVVDSGSDSSGGLSLGTTMLASGGALVAGGLVVNFAIVNPTWADIQAANDNPYSISRSDADTLTSRFNTSRFLTIGLTAGGLAVMGTGMFIDAPIRPVLGPGQLGVWGRF